MSKVEFQDISEYAECYRCKGKGYERPLIICRTCNGTGLYKRTNYILIAETPDGQKIAFQVDTIK